MVSEVIEHYRAVLADLEKSRVSLDGFIAEVRRKIIELGGEETSNGIGNLQPRQNSFPVKRHRRSKLTPEQVEQIMARHREGQTQLAIAREFGVSRGTVYNVISANRDAEAR